VAVPSPIPLISTSSDATANTSAGADIKATN